MSADLRAPTPTGAAEMVVPMRINLLAQIQDNHERLIKSAARLVTERRNILSALSAQLGDPKHLFETKLQTIDILGEKLGYALKENIQKKKIILQTITDKSYESKVSSRSKKTITSVFRITTKQNDSTKNQRTKHTSYANLERMLKSLSPKGVLNRGYALGI